MGLLDGLMGNASEVNPARIEGYFARVMASGERIAKAYQLIRNLFVFTNERLLLVEEQGLREQGGVQLATVQEHHALQRGIAGHFDLDAELKIRISGSHPAHLRCPGRPGRLRAGRAFLPSAASM